MVSELEQQILAALRKLEEAVGSLRTAGPKPVPPPLFAQLEELTRQLPKTADPDLLHYLHRKSYQKARLLLEGRGAENAPGKCEPSN
jgi:hypothetical protein